MRGLEDFSHIWLLWGFSQAERPGWSPTVRPPRLGGNTRLGVFATRSPYRPNSIGLSSVKIERIETHSKDGPLIHVLGADLLDGTPIYDIKPYLAYTDSHPDASSAFAGAEPPLHVHAAQWPQSMSKKDREALAALLALDPRPSYQNDPQRVYGMEYGRFEVKFCVDGEVLTVREITECKKQD